MPNCPPDPAPRRFGAIVAVLAGVLAVAGCALSDGARFPSAAVDGTHPGHRLGDIHPQVYTRGGEVFFLLCRWSTEAPVPVSIPADASSTERQAIEDVLRAYEGAGLGLRFVTTTGTRSAIDIELYDDPVPTPAGLDAGNTVSDCRIREDPIPPDATRAGVELVAATLRVARTAPDWSGNGRPLSAEELRGVLLHEMGHALGYSGHARRGKTVMVREVDMLRNAGEDLLRGEPFRDATLAALYAHPNGFILARQSVEAWRTDRVDRMTALASRHGLDGPFLRTGETQSRIYWSDRRGLQYGLVLVNLVDTLRDPGVALVAPEARTRRALPRSRDLRPESFP